MYVLPLLGIFQFGNAGFLAFFSRWFYTSFNLRLGFIFSCKNTIITIFLLLLCLCMKELRVFNSKQAPWLILTSISGVFLNGQLYPVSQIHSSPWHVAEFQPLFQVIVVWVSIYIMEVEGKHYMKVAGMVCCLAGTIFGVIY